MSLKSNFELPAEMIETRGRSETLGRRVKDEVKKAVMAARFRPGQKLTIRGIAKELGVSLTPVREALYHLASEGVLEMRSNGSVYVPELTRERIEELTKIRVALECLAAREAIRRLSDNDIDTIDQINQELIVRDEKGEYAELLALNWKFHFSIYAASGMDQLVRMIESCWLMNGSYLNMIYPAFGEVSEGINNHIQIVRALRARDPDRVASTINTDINLAADALLQAVREQGARNENEL
jgi:DNA-binding GntR family transcriptional regulator